MADTHLALSEAEIDEIVAELSQRPERLPKKAICRAREHWEQVLPKLIDAMRDAVAVWRDGDDPGDAAFFGLFLCTEMAEREAWPIIREILVLPDDGPFALFGDAIHEVVPQTLVAIAAGQVDELDRLLGDAEVDIYVRWSIGKTFAMFVRDGLLSHDEAVARLQHHLKHVLALRASGQLAAEDSPMDDEGMWPTVIVDALYNLLPHDAADDMFAAFEAKLIDETIIGGPKDVQKRIDLGEEGLQRQWERLPAARLEDTVAELSKWGSFREPESRTSYNEVDRQRIDDEPWEPAPKSATTIVRESPKVSRNDPCPCGSGKKFKKCCGRK